MHVLHSADIRKHPPMHTLNKTPQKQSQHNQESFKSHQTLFRVGAHEDLGIRLHTHLLM